jgi:hypothetical protein
MLAEAPVKVSVETHTRVKLAATMLKCSLGKVIDLAMAEYIENHRDQMSVGIDRAREALLGGDAGMLAYLSGATPEEIQTLGGV